MGDRSEEWDNKNAKPRSKWGSPRVLLLLIAVMIVMWFVYGTLTVMLQPIDCQEINNFIDSPAYFQLNDVDKQMADQVWQDNCNQRNVK